MAAPTIFSSSDASAPTLSGTAGDFVNLLDKCLSDGYGAKSALGWTKSFTASNKRVYKQPAGSALYLDVDDSGASATGGAREAICRGYEVMTAVATGTNPFPTIAQAGAAVGTVWRKSSTADATTRSWVLIGDDQGFYFFCQSGDSAGVYTLHGFGDIYSNVSGDAYKSFIMGRSVGLATALSSHEGGQHIGAVSTGSAGHWICRNYTGLGASTRMAKIGDGSMQNSVAAINMAGVLSFPNGADGGAYISPLRVLDGSTPGTTIAGQFNMRGRMRGLWHLPYAVGSFADQDVLPGIGEYAGRSFLVFTPVMGTTAAGALVAVETTAWDVST